MKGYKQLNMLIALVALILVDVIGLNYETNDINSKIVPFVKLIAYFLLIKGIYKKLDVTKTKKAISISFGIVVLLNILLFYYVIWSDYLKINDNIERSIFLFYGIIVLGICIGAANYNFRYETRKSLYFFYCVYAIVLSDFTWFIGYYLEFNEALYLDVLFYFIGFYNLLLYSFEVENKEIQPGNIALDR